MSDYLDKRRKQLQQAASQAASVASSAAQAVVGKSPYKIKPNLVVDFYRMEAPVDWQDMLDPKPLLAINQCTYGKGQDDQFFNFHKQIAGMFPDWPYHFMVENDVEPQYKNYLAAVKGMDTLFWPVVDVELDNRQLKNPGSPWAYQVGVWIDAVSNALGKQVVVYSNRYYSSFLLDKNGDPPKWWNQVMKWVGWYPWALYVDANTILPKSRFLSGVNGWDIWQYAQDGRYRGFLANDLSTINSNSPIIQFLKGD